MIKKEGACLHLSSSWLDVRAGIYPGMQALRSSLSAFFPSVPQCHTLSLTHNGHLTGRCRLSGILPSTKKGPR